MSSRRGAGFLDPASEEVGSRLAAARRFLAGLDLQDEAVFDHIGVQAYSDVDYVGLRTELGTMGECLSERLAGGRHISNVAIRMPGRTPNGSPTLLVELFAPKPDQVDPGRPPRLWHVAFVLPDILQRLPALERAGVRVSMRLTVGAKEVLFLLADGGEEVELASMPLAGPPERRGEPASSLRIDLEGPDR